MAKISKILTKQIIDSKKINSLFKNAHLKNLNINCSILNGDFYIDSHNYFPITYKDFHTFPDQFMWNSSTLYYSKKFKDNFFRERENAKTISDAYVLGTSPGNNYYRNIITFLYRLHFISDKAVNIAIHRNTSNETREFIKYFLKLKQIKFGKFFYLDDGFYLFKNSQIPGFISDSNVIKIYESLFKSNEKNTGNIYITRRNAKWRQIINEVDYTSHLEKEGFEIIEFENLSIKKQIDMIQKSNKILAPHGSGLVNLVFSMKKKQVVEIVQKKINKNLMSLYLKYKRISKIKKNQHYFFEADLVDKDHTAHLKTRNIGEKLHIGKTNIRNNPYFKNFIVQESELKKLITNFGKR